MGGARDKTHDVCVLLASEHMPRAPHSRPESEMRTHMRHIDIDTYNDEGTHTYDSDTREQATHLDGPIS